MPSRSSESRLDQNGGPRRTTSQDGRSTVQMRMKFYEINSRERSNTSSLTTNRTHTQQPTSLTTPHQRQSALEPQGGNHEEEPIYAKINRRNRHHKHSSEKDRTLTTQDKSHGERHVSEDVQIPATLPSNGHREVEVRRDTRRRSRRATTKQPLPDSPIENGIHDITSKPAVEITHSRHHRNGHTSATYDSKERTFLSGAEIGKIYQHSKIQNDESKDKKTKHVNGLRSRSMVDMETESLQDGPCANDYHWKIIESKTALNKVRKSLSNDNALEIINHNPAESEEISASRKARRQRRKKRLSENKRERSGEDILDCISKEEVVYQPASKDDIMSVASHLFTGKIQGKTSKLVLPPPTRVEDEKPEKITSEKDGSQRENSHSILYNGRSSPPGLKLDGDSSSSHAREEMLGGRGKKSSKDAETGSQVSRVKLLASTHEALSKQDSGNSLLSNTSGGSAMSKKLFSLSEDNPSPQVTPQKSKKKFTKRFSWKNSSRSEELESAEDSSLSQDDKKTRMKENKKNRRTTSAVEYTLADISPAPIRTERSRTLPHLRLGEISEIKSGNHFQPLARGDDKSDLRRDRSLSSSQTRTSSSQSSLLGGDPQLVFRVDLDKPYHGNIEQSIRKENRISAPRIKREIFESENGLRESKAKLREDKKPNKWIQTDGPPIRPPNASTSETQTGANPCTTASKKLQLRPWNLPEHLASKISQTTPTRTSEMGTQTHEAGYRTQSSQTKTKRFQNLMTQTPLLPLKKEIGIQVTPETLTTESQTPDEDSEVWGGGNGVSLDRLIRNGAIKRTQSMGQGVIDGPDMPRDRSASIDVLSRKNKSDQKGIPLDGTETSGKITTYNWNENGKFVKVFISYSGIHLLPSKNIQVKTNGINLILTVEEPMSEDSNEPAGLSAPSSGDQTTLTSRLYLNRLRRPVACLSYNIQRDMITIMLRKQKQTPWNALVFGGKAV